jgi:hypothetical protein
MIKIALSGKGGVGKNTIASLMAQNILHLKNNEYIIAAFAERIKSIIQKFFPGCDPEALYGASELRQKKIESELDIAFPDEVTYRQVSCDIGKLGRSYSSLIWIMHIARQMKRAPESTQLFIISDLRFIDEFNWAKKNGFVMCRIKRNEQLKLNDISETEQDELTDDQFDMIIDNNCSIKELKTKVTLTLDKHFSNNKAYLQVRNAAI